MNDTRTDDPGSLTVLVAVEVPSIGDSDPSANVAWAQGIVSGLLVRGLKGDIANGLKGDLITAWWIAEDERYDRSDNDSAVFVPMGQQAYWAAKVAFEREHPPCTNCGRSEYMDTERCDQIKHECLDCCGCPDHTSDIDETIVAGRVSIVADTHDHQWKWEDTARPYTLDHRICIRNEGGTVWSVVTVSEYLEGEE